MHAAVLPLGGGVSSFDARRLRGQSTIEYVLLIAIVALVVIVAGPGVASAIRNQFNTVTDAIGSGTAGENFYDAVDLPDPQNGTAFAVYSEDDHSLMFYKRRGVPAVGDMFNYRKVTEVYTGFETAIYSNVGFTETSPSSEENWLHWETDVPWFDIRDEIWNATVVDEGIKPRYLKMWFYRCSNLRKIDLSKLNGSEIIDLWYMCVLDTSLVDLSLPGLSGVCESIADLASSNPNLETLKIEPSDFSGVGDAWHALYNNPKLNLDCSDWNLRSRVRHDGFNSRSPGVIAPSVWQS